MVNIINIGILFTVVCRKYDWWNIVTPVHMSQESYTMENIVL